MHQTYKLYVTAETKQNGNEDCILAVSIHMQDISRRYRHRFITPNKDYMIRGKHPGDKQRSDIISSQSVVSGLREYGQADGRNGGRTDGKTNAHLRYPEKRYVDVRRQDGIVVVVVKDPKAMWNKNNMFAPMVFQNDNAWFYGDSQYKLEITHLAVNKKRTSYISKFSLRCPELETVRGIGAGSVYCSTRAMAHGFPLECEKKRVIVVKTHRRDDEYDKAVVVIRNPFFVLFSFFQFKQTHGHSKYVEMQDFEDHFAGFVKSKIVHWENMYHYWLETFTSPVYLVIYDYMLQHTNLELGKVATFLNINYTQEDMFCTLKNQRGLYFRDKSNITIQSVYDQTSRRIVEKASERIMSVINAKFPRFSNFSFQSFDNIY
ncbi:hypothetical protein ScPMuIL_013045 [Solemya velum]